MDGVIGVIGEGIWEAVRDAGGSLQHENNAPSADRGCYLLLCSLSSSGFSQY